jgi:hypothetical protein
VRARPLARDFEQPGDLAARDPAEQQPIGDVIFLQGADVNAAGGCAVARLTLSDTVVMTIG